MAELIPAAVDVVLICGVLVLIGLLYATHYTFSVVVAALDISILGQRPFHSVAKAIEGTLLDWCNKGINASGKILDKLWNGLAWMLNETVSALETFAADTESALGYLWSTSLPAYVVAKLKPLAASAAAALSSATTTATHLVSEVSRLDQSIKTATAAAVTQAETRATTELGKATAAIDTRIGTLERTLHGDITTGEQGLANEITTVAGDLRDYEQAVPLKQLIALLGTYGGVLALSQLLTAEAGLGRAECRSKVNQLCTTDPLAWSNLLADLTVLEIGLSLRELLPVAREGVTEFGPAVSAAA